MTSENVTPQDWLWFIIPVGIIALCERLHAFVGREVAISL